MAKRKVKGANCNCAVPMVGDSYKPRMYIDVQDEDVEMLGELKVGEIVTVAIKGKLVAVSQNTNETKDSGKAVSGSFSLEGYEVEIINAGDFEALAEED